MPYKGISACDISFTNHHHATSLQLPHYYNWGLTSEPHFWYQMRTCRLDFTFTQVVDVHWHLLVYYTTDENLHNTQIKDLKNSAMEK